MSDTQAKATPRPWKYEPDGSGGMNDCCVWGPQGPGYGAVCNVASTGLIYTSEQWQEFKANANLIVRSVNNHGKLLEALKELVRVVGGTLQGYGILEAPMKAAEAAIQSGEEPGSASALSAVRARWERLGLDPATAPTVFASDVENMVEEELRRLRDGAGRAVVQYSDPAL